MNSSSWFENGNLRAREAMIRLSYFFGALFSVGVAYADPDEVLSHTTSVAWQITLRSAEKKKESGASEDVSDEDLCILILGSLLHFDKVEVEFIKKGSSTTEELEAFVSALQVAGTKRGQDKASGGRGSELERYLVRIIANQADIPLLYVPLEAVMSKYYGESERLLGAVFSQANEISDGAIIFLDEIDGFEQDKKVVVIATTNRK
uniref:ATPase AAA-type core domain-containing protein n=1 Tax=Brassica campestris TaxID=3711 RepID=M4EMC1_BRACM